MKENKRQLSNDDEEKVEDQDGTDGTEDEEDNWPLVKLKKRKKLIREEESEHDDPNGSPDL